MPRPYWNGLYSWAANPIHPVRGAGEARLARKTLIHKPRTTVDTSGGCARRSLLLRPVRARGRARHASPLLERLVLVGGKPHPSGSRGGRGAPRPYLVRAGVRIR